ncbi:MAG: hypothetical protein QOE58_1598 [Actinomycetota bacterium]|jgi:hypothetical protein|nr:hypothetical protein [Actinomycetota bacterium]
MASLRSLANAARMIEGYPALRELRSLLAVERTGGTVVLTVASAEAHRKTLPELEIEQNG